MSTAKKIRLPSDLFPEPPAGKTGWPWDVSLPKFPERMEDGSPWPKITLVTPNYNYGHFIEKTIRSVLLQGYPNLEFLVHDDGSTDNSREIILKYQDFLTFSPDQNHGQSYQIAKGFESGTGEIFNWLNSDDYLLPGALKKVAEAWRRDRPDFVVGTTVQTDESGKELCVFKPKAPQSPFDFFKDYAVSLPQPSVFLSAKLLKQAGGVRRDLRYFMDWELYFRLYSTPGNILKASVMNETLAHAVLHPQAKTASYGKILEKEFLALLKEQENHQDQKLRRVINQQFNLRKTKSILSEFGQNGPVSTREFFQQFKICPQLLLTRFGW